MLTNTAFDAFLVATGATIYNLLVEHEELGLPPFESANLDVGTGATIAINGTGELGRNELALHVGGCLELHILGELLAQLLLVPAVADNTLLGVVLGIDACLGIHDAGADEPYLGGLETELHLHGTLVVVASALDNHGVPASLFGSHLTSLIYSKTSGLAAIGGGDVFESPVETLKLID